MLLKLMCNTYYDTNNTFMAGATACPRTLLLSLKVLMNDETHKMKHTPRHDLKTYVAEGLADWQGCHFNHGGSREEVCFTP